MDEEDEDTWDLERLLDADETVVPPRQTTVQLVQAYRNTWSSPEIINLMGGNIQLNDISAVIRCICTRLSINPSNFNWAEYDRAYAKERVQLLKLQSFMQHHRIDGQPLMEFFEATNIIYNCRDVMKQAARFIVNMNPQDEGVRQMLPPESRDSLDVDNENIFKHSEKDLTPWQNAFVHLREILEGCRFRRADGNFFERIILSNGIETNAFKIACSVEEFVAQHTAHDSYFKVWKQITSSSGNFKTMVEYLTERPMGEAPDLSENDDIRSFSGGGIGPAGIYNSDSDMFFDYSQKDDWERQANEVTQIRRKLFDPNYTCTPPKADDVCVVHLECAFPHNIYEEVKSIDTERLHCKWVEVDEYECRHHRHHPHAKLDEPELAKLILERANGMYHNKEDHCPRIRVELTDEDVQHVDPNRISAFTFVEIEGRYFRVHTGMAYFDCATKDIDHIYNCQNFTSHDKWFMHAVFGRIFFRVHRKDKAEGTIFMEGIGGCGKSTVIKAYQMFWPMHLRGILSSNIEDKFGMAEVAKGKVAWCTEIAKYLNMKQEEWQDGTGAGSLSLAQKYGKPLKIENWHAQFVWAGNDFPENYRNGALQVTRRLYGVGMYKSVKPRDMNVMERIKPNVGMLLRKDILAYDDWRLQYGPVDPNSEPNFLPPAFRNYFRNTKAKTNPIIEMVECGNYVEKDSNALMLMSDFKQLYNQYRQDFDIGSKMKWGEEVYRASFNELDIQVFKNTDCTIDGVDHKGVDAIQGIKPATK